MTDSSNSQPGDAKQHCPDERDFYLDHVTLSLQLPVRGPSVSISRRVAGRIALWAKMWHNVHMLRITIRELHLHTGKWVRQAAQSTAVIVLDRGRPIAQLAPLDPAPDITFRDRKLVRGFSSLRPISADSGRMLEEERR
jgi:antitoxin (DNA-binding transcriptional repressor) of toxin-antitoxin stability system